MRRVEVEIPGRDDDVLRVGCLKNEQAARPEHSDRFGNEPSQLLKVHVLDYVKCRNQGEARIGEAR
jgi:hypothetical protein